MTYTSDSADLDAPSVLRTVGSTVQLSMNHLGNVTSSQLDHYFPAEKRQASKRWVTDFATERPYLASFLLFQLVLSGPPLAFFLITTTTLVTFFVLGGLIVGVLGALLLTLFVVGIGLAFLLPILFFTTVAALSVWLWGSIIFYIVKRLNNGRGPSLPIDFASGLSKPSDSSQFAGINSEGDSTTKPKNAAQYTREVGSTDHSKRPAGNREGDEKGEAIGITTTVVDG
ncbi:hypothetical protein DV735_g5649, partial [Chaetothyriales sp. CBS 134920]